MGLVSPRAGLYIWMEKIILPLPEVKHFLSWPAHSLITAEWGIMSTYIYKTSIIQGVYISYICEYIMLATKG